jgi:hypothetical protein
MFSMNIYALFTLAGIAGEAFTSSAELVSPQD